MLFMDSVAMHRRVGGATHSCRQVNKLWIVIKTLSL